MKAKIWNYSDWIEETNPETLMDAYEKKLRLSGFNILGRKTHYFKPQGFTALFLLCESHFAIHTFPEENKTYIELSSCNLEYFKTFISLCN